VITATFTVPQVTVPADLTVAELRREATGYMLNAHRAVSSLVEQWNQAKADAYRAEADRREAAAR